MIKKCFIYCLIVIFLSGTTGCNIFSWLHEKEVGAEGLIADGKGHLDAGDYDKAEESFALAMAENPNNSDARYWHAIAVARLNGISIAELGIDFFSSLASGSMEGGDLFKGLNEDELESLYNAANIITTDLRPIILETTEGEIKAANVALSFIINLTLTTIIFLAKIKAAFEEFGFTIDENGNIVFENINKVDGIKNVINTTLGLLDDTAEGYNAITGMDEETSDFKDKTDTLYNSIYLYAVADGEDNDGDGEIDEEWLDGIDNDGDGLIDEDSNGLPGP